MSATPPLAIVTGGAGFIGSHLVDFAVNRGFAVRVIDDLSGGREGNLRRHAGNPRVSLERKDIRALDPGDFAGARYVFHFAGIGDIVPSIERPVAYMDINVQGTVRVLEAARAAGVEKMVYAASSSCYGVAAVPTTEDHPVQPRYPYALSKHMGEMACRHWHEVYGLPVNAIRIFNAYGPRVRTTGAYGAVFGVFMRQKLAGKPFTVVGDGTQSRDFVFVTDIAEAFWLAAERGAPGRFWNLGAGNPQSVNRLVELLGGPVIHLPKRPGEPDCTFADISRITAELGWHPRIPFEEGVRRMLDDIEAWRDAPLWDTEGIARATATWFKYLDKETSP
ncbi:MAG: GDP-mannose 4,6-dehydratase [Rhodospirillales bacterium]|nr:GDP-mannose 4,6-dehydratase [Rhodospirillales bacterium]